MIEDSIKAVREAEAKADQLIADAKRQADEIVAKAKADAEQLKADAANEDSARQAAPKTGSAVDAVIGGLF